MSCFFNLFLIEGYTVHRNPHCNYHVMANSSEKEQGAHCRGMYAVISEETGFHTTQCKGTLLTPLRTPTANGKQQAPADKTKNHCFKLQKSSEVKHSSTLTKKEDLTWLAKLKA